VSGRRLIVGVIGMGIILPLTLFLLLGLQTVSQLFTIAASTLLAWGAADLLASILEKPRLSNRTPGGAIRDEWK
jgi:hypothetical protein